MSFPLKAPFQPNFPATFMFARSLTWPLHPAGPWRLCRRAPFQLQAANRRPLTTKKRRWSLKKIKRDQPIELLRSSFLLAKNDGLMCVQQKITLIEIWPTKWDAIITHDGFSNKNLGWHRSTSLKSCVCICTCKIVYVLSKCIYIYTHTLCMYIQPDDWLHSIRL